MSRPGSGSVGQLGLYRVTRLHDSLFLVEWSRPHGHVRNGRSSLPKSERRAIEQNGPRCEHAVWMCIGRSLPSANVGDPGGAGQVFLLLHRSAVRTIEEVFDRAAVLFQERPRVVCGDQLDSVAGVSATTVDRPTAPAAAGAACASDEPLAARAQVKSRALEVKSESCE